MNSNNDLCNLVAQFRSFIREFFLRLFLVLPYIFFFIIFHQKMFLSFISVFAFWVSFVINSSVLCEILTFVELLLQFFRETSFYFVKSTDSISLSIVISAASEILIQVHWICEVILTENSSEFLHRKGKTCFNIINSE